MKYLLFPVILLQIMFVQSAFAQNKAYWNRNNQVIPWRLPLPDEHSFRHEDLDSDGDPDVIYSFINDSVPVIWIDDDDDMNPDDFEGDTDNDCLLIDRNKDGIFAGPNDFSVDWADENEDGIADLQIVAQNGGIKNRNFFDWEADFMIFIDKEKDGIQHFIDWNEIRMKAWEHNGHSNFFEDYHGNTLFLKMHASTFRISDLRFSWENPFLFYDTDKDGLSEWTIRMVDTPHFRPKTGESAEFSKVNPEFDVIYSEKIDWVGISWDLDNDNGQGNEFDFDMSLRFTGPGFGYADQVHKFKTLRGLEEANRLMYDSRWRKMDELIYPDHQSAWPLIFGKGEWTECRLVFDEDDDCNRWERVEFYDPRNLFKTGRNGGGLDHNGQADAAGDRGEFDLDNSGKGQLYVGTFDGRIHLYGAEWGAWRIDQTAFSFQGFGGLYDRWKGGRIQRNPDSFATVKYTDTDLNGFFDRFEYDLDGDTIFEETVSLKDLGISDATNVINTSKTNYLDFQKLFRNLADTQSMRARQLVVIAKNLGINPNWYAFWMNPRTLHEKYEYGYWLNFYLYRDIRHWASVNRKNLVHQLDKAYYSGDWEKIKLNK
ncbi:MAG TPA: hypothetical protein DHV48_16805 [Prolixibacteraceae bacterium]|nr:hypothetical protein [Prolixibacteraceae bacterium]